MFDIAYNGVNTNMYYDGKLGVGWQTPSFGSNWTHYGGAYGNVYFRRFGDLVNLTGLVKVAANATASTTLFTLPAGYRPAKQLLFLVMTSVGPTRVDIDTSGNVQTVGATFNTAGQWVSVDGINFFTT